MSIKVKNHKVLMSLLAVPYHQNLIQVLVWVSIRYHDLVITSGYRDGDKGVHGLKPCRGIDIRSWIYNDPQKIVDDINSYWEYDTQRKYHIINGNKKLLLTAKYHDTGSGDHIHLQAHPRTKYHNIARII